MSCANPANERIVGHLHQLEHQSSQRGNSKLKFTIRKAIRSIRLFPLPIQSIEDAKLLEGVGDFLASKIARFIGTESNASKPAEAAPCLHSPPAGAEAAAAAATAPVRDAYVPSFGKGPWYALVSTWLAGATASHTAAPKADLLQKLNQAFASRDLPHALRSGQGTWNSSIRAVVSRGLLQKMSSGGRECRYYLTAAGSAAAQQAVNCQDAAGLELVRRDWPRIVSVRSVNVVPMLVNKLVRSGLLVSVHSRIYILPRSSGYPIDLNGMRGNGAWFLPIGSGARSSDGHQWS